MKLQENYYARTEINQRDNNEDNLDKSEFYVMGEPPITVLSVADGMGGHEHGEDVSTEGLLKFSLTLFGELKAVERALPLTSEKLKQALINATNITNSHIRLMVESNKWHKAGSTIVSAAVWRDRVIAVNLGDSPLFHYEAETGQLVKVTLDHSVPAILAQAGLITEEMARGHERRGQLEFFLGCDSMPDPLPVYERVLQPGDLLLFCSDGVSGSLRLVQIQQILAQKDTNLAQKADLLIRASLEAGETDNQTLILWCHLGASNSQIAASSIATSSISNHHPSQEDRQEQARGQAPQLLQLSLSENELKHIPQSSIDRVRKSSNHRLIRRLITARNGSWLLFGSIVTMGAVALGISDPGLVRTVNLFKFIPKQLEELIPKASPKGSDKTSPGEIPGLSQKTLVKESIK